MARTATVTLQTIWDCRWSRPACPPGGLTLEAHDGLWVCVLPQGNIVRRPVAAEECSACPYWQAELLDEA